MNHCAEWDPCEPVCSDAVKQLLTRHSVGPKHLVPPAPTEEQVWLAVWSALRAPDHQKLLPFRFVLIPDKMRPLLGELFADFARRSSKSEEEIVVERERAMLGPLLLAFVARIEYDHPKVPPHEQWLAAGGALSNFLTALHVMGFGAKMLSGRKATDPIIHDAFCEPGETLVGWIAVGTASKAPHPRHNDSPDAILRRWQPA
jgi:nitroreductase